MFISLLYIKQPAVRLLAGLVLAAVLSACEAPTLPPPSLTPPAPPAVPTAAVTPLPITPQPTVPAFTATKDVRIDIDAGDYQVKGMAPNRSVQLPGENAPYGLVIHYPFPVGGYQVSSRIADPKSVTWLLETVPAPDANSVAFILSGGNIGFFNVEVRVGNSTPVRFQVQVMGRNTPVPPPPTPAPVTLRPLIEADGLIGAIRS